MDIETMERDVNQKTNYLLLKEYLQGLISTFHHSKIGVKMMDPQ